MITKSAMFTLPKKSMLHALGQINKVIKYSRKHGITLEITVYDGYIKLVVPGIDLDLAATTSGTAKATIYLWYITDIINNEKSDVLVCKIIYDQLHINSSVYKAQTTYFDSDTILRSINLPINYSLSDLARLFLSERYTSDELSFNNLNESVTNALYQLKHDIAQATILLKKYEVRKKEIQPAYNTSFPTNNCKISS